MSIETVNQVLQALPNGCHPHRLDNFINGTVSVTKRKTVKMTIEFDIQMLGSPYEDIRAVLSPFDNKLIPILVFVDPLEFVESRSKATGERK